jgi:putative ABC transport system substrate-binding protein
VAASCYSAAATGARDRVSQQRIARFRPFPSNPLPAWPETDGYTEGQNVTVEYRFAENQYDRLPALATDLIHLHSAVIVAGGDDKVVQAVRKARATIPTVSAFDPEERAFANHDSPADNFTRVAVFSTALTSKRLEVLRDLLPNVSVVGFIVNPRNPNAASDIKEIQEAGQKLGLQIIVINAADERDFEAAFAELVRQGSRAITMQADALLMPPKIGLFSLPSSTQCLSSTHDANLSRRAV